MFFKKLDDGLSPQKKTVSVNFSRACSLFDLLTFEDWTDKLSQNVGTELPLYAT